MMMAVPGATWSRKLTELLEYPVVERPVWELLCVGSVIAGVVVCLLGRPDVAVVPLTVIIVVALGMLAHGGPALDSAAAGLGWDRLADSHRHRDDRCICIDINATIPSNL